MIRWSTAPQGTEEWLAARRGAITASRFKDTRDKLKNGDFSAKAKLYAMDVARERCGGHAAEVYQNAAMRFGHEQEPIARMASEDTRGYLIEEAGFASTEDGKFGVSVDGLIDTDGVWECKTMVSSDTLFKAVVQRDISEYIDQCNGAMWLLGRKWVDLCLWAPDLPSSKLTIIRIERDDDAIEALEADLIAFERLVSQYEAQLRKLMATESSAAPPWEPAPESAAPSDAAPVTSTTQPAKASASAPASLVPSF